MHVSPEERAARLRRIWQLVLLVAPPFLAFTAASENRTAIPIRIVAGAVGLALGIGLAWLIGPTKARFVGPPPGTRAFEAFHTAALLERVIHERKVELGRTQDAARKAHLEREVPFLEGQLQKNRAIVAAKDRSPGRGSIGFEPFQGS